MLSVSDLTLIARHRLKDARALLSKRRYDGAAYLCGYAIEVALKARIVRTLKWAGFPETSAEFDRYRSFKTHDLDVLLHLSGWEAKIKAAFVAEWSAISGWDPESRYDRPGTVSHADAGTMVETTNVIVGALL